MEQVQFGPGFWHVLKVKGAPELREGGVVQVERAGGSYLLIKPGVGQVASLRIDQTGVGSNGRIQRVTNQQYGLELLLSPAGPEEIASPESGAGYEDDVRTLIAGEPASIIRTYKGQPDAAAQLMQREAEILARFGYLPISQQYVTDEWGCGAWVVAALLLVFIVGFVVLAYMIANHPDGTLTVIYERRGYDAVQPESKPGTPPGPATEVETTQTGDQVPAKDTKVCPDCAETIKAGARICRFCRHEFWPATASEEPGSRSDAS